MKGPLPFDTFPTPFASNCWDEVKCVALCGKGEVMAIISQYQPRLLTWRSGE